MAQIVFTGSGTTWRNGARIYTLTGKRYSRGISTWYGDTMGGLNDVFERGHYITQGFWDGRSEGEKSWLKTNCAGIVFGDYVETYYVQPYEGTEYEQYWQRQTWYRINPANVKPLPTLDPCKDVSCPDKCVGVDKYDQVCQDGICVRGALVETNSEHCGYTPEPTPDPTPTPPSDTYVIIALMLAGTYIILRR